MKITHVKLTDPSVGYDENDNEHPLASPMRPGTYHPECGKVFDARDERWGCCVDCTFDTGRG